MTKFLLGFFSFDWLRFLDFLPPLLLRLFLAPLLWVSGSNLLGLFSSADFIWFNPFTWVNLDNPVFEATAAGLAHLPFVGEGLATLVGMSIGWLEVVGAFLLFIGFAVRWVSLPLLALTVLTAIVALNGESVIAALKSLLNNHGYTDMSGTAFSKALVYFIMILTLFFMGAGRFFSVDWFLYRKLNKKIAASTVTQSAGRVQQDIKSDPFDLDNTTD